MFGFFLTKNFCFLANYILPAYHTHKCLQSENSDLTKDEWLRYWMLLGIATCFEFYADMFIFWIPFYYELKLSFFLWLAYSRGADILYEKVLRPRLVVHEVAIDTALEQVKFQVLNQTVVVGKNILIWSQQKVMMMLAEGQIFAMKQMFSKAANEANSTDTTNKPANKPQEVQRDVPQESEVIEQLYPNLKSDSDSKEQNEESLGKDEINQFEVIEKEDEIEKSKSSKPKNVEKKTGEKNFSRKSFKK